MNPVFLFLEITSTLLFIGVAWAALRRGRLPFLELISAAAFGLLLEEGDQLIFQTYHYSPAWTLVLDRAPLVIGLSWALLLAGAMRITDALGVRSRAAPLVDAVLVVAIDLAIEATAIRMGMWTWVDVGPTQGWFGVPAGNFYSWLFVTLGFSLVTRWVRTLAANRPALDWLQLAVPLPAFAILIASIVPFAYLKPILEPEPGGGLWMFATTFAAFLAIAGYGVFGPGRERPDGQGEAIVDLRLAFFTRFSIHGFYLFSMVALGIASQLPVLLITALVLLAAELPLARLVAIRLAAARGLPAPASTAATLAAADG